jgi:hypothetical protein
MRATKKDRLMIECEALELAAKLACPMCGGHWPHYSRDAHEGSSDIWYHEPTEAGHKLKACAAGSIKEVLHAKRLQLKRMLEKPSPADDDTVPDPEPEPEETSTMGHPPEGDTMEHEELANS